MNMRKMISVVLTAALILSCVPQTPPRAKATTQTIQTQTEPTVLYSVTDLGAEGAVIVENIEEAFSQIKAKNRQWKA